MPRRILSTECVKSANGWVILRAIQNAADANPITLSPAMMNSMVVSRSNGTRASASGCASDCASAGEAATFDAPSVITCCQPVEERVSSETPMPLMLAKPLAASRSSSNPMTIHAMGSGVVTWTATIWYRRPSSIITLGTPDPALPARRSAGTGTCEPAGARDPDAAITRPSSDVRIAKAALTRSLLLASTETRVAVS